MKLKDSATIAPEGHNCIAELFFLNDYPHLIDRRNQYINMNHDIDMGNQICNFKIPESRAHDDCNHRAWIWINSATAVINLFSTPKLWCKDKNAIPWQKPVHPSLLFRRPNFLYRFSSSKDENECGLRVRVNLTSRRWPGLIRQVLGHPKKVLPVSSRPGG